MRTIFPALSYDESLKLLATHKLNDLLPPANKCQINLRRKRPFQSQPFRTDRFKKSFIVYNALKTRA